MSKYCIRSKCLPVITEALKKMSIMEDDFTATPPQMNQNGEFETNIETEQEDITIPGAEVEKQDDSEPKTKEELISMATEKLKASIDIASELDDIIAQIRSFDGNEHLSNEWVPNEDKNDVYLASKDAHIFIQNDNILLSHDGVVEIFKSVAELHNWLNENDYPLPPRVEIHESLVNIDKLGIAPEDVYKDDYGYYVLTQEDKVIKGPFQTKEMANLWIQIHFHDNQNPEYQNMKVEYIGEVADE